MPTPATGLNSIPVETPCQELKPPPSSSDIPTLAFVTESYFLQCDPVVENHAVIVTVEEEDQTAGTLAVTRSKSKAAKETPSDAEPTSSSPATRSVSISTPIPAIRSASIPASVPITHPVVIPASSASVPTPSQPVSLETGKTTNTETKKEPAFRYELKAALLDAAKRLYDTILNTPIHNLTISDLLSISLDLRKEAVNYSRTQRVPTPSATHPEAALTTSLTNPPPLQIEHATPLCEIRVTLNGTHSELGLLDEGSEIVVIQEDIWKKTNAPINQNVRMRMQTANGGSQEMAGCLEMLEIDIAESKLGLMHT
ncbi:hypothetical protein BDR05DRAFT_944595 [Suillus weaverae]|nr:hypothetical protein BDR05DRAFT_944595 [Suillus weaverae]